MILAMSTVTVPPLTLVVAMSLALLVVGVLVSFCDRVLNGNRHTDLDEAETRQDSGVIGERET